jgi:hypothetical protein
MSGPYSGERVFNDFCITGPGVKLLISCAELTPGSVVHEIVAALNAVHALREKEISRLNGVVCTKNAHLASARLLEVETIRGQVAERAGQLRQAVEDTIEGRLLMGELLSEHNRLCAALKELVGSDEKSGSVLAALRWQRSHRVVPSPGAPGAQENAAPQNVPDLRMLGYAPGPYTGVCSVCNRTMHDVDGRATCCRECAEKRAAFPMSCARCGATFATMFAASNHVCDKKEG